VTPKRNGVVFKEDSLMPKRTETPSFSVFAAVGSINRVKKKDEDIFQVQVQPKKLFEGEKSVKKLFKTR
jgi:hypothetical protein